MRPKITIDVGVPHNPDICCDGFCLDFCGLLHGAGTDENGEGRIRCALLGFETTVPRTGIIRPDECKALELLADLAEVDAEEEAAKGPVRV